MVQIDPHCQILFDQFLLLPVSIAVGATAYFGILTLAPKRMSRMGDSREAEGKARIFDMDMEHCYTL